MIHRNIRIPLIITSILVITSFAPFIQIAILFTNGGIFSLINSSDSVTQFLFNGSFALLLAALFFKSKTRKHLVLTALGFIFFFFPLVTNATDNRIPDDPFFLRILILSIVTGSILIGIGAFKNKKE
jgi:hypothetical protein